MRSSITRRPFLALAAAAALSASIAPTLAQAQAWPDKSKPVTIISVFPPGGSVDQVSRLLASELAKNTGGQFIVENKGVPRAQSEQQRLPRPPPMATPLPWCLTPIRSIPHSSQTSPLTP